MTDPIPVGDRISADANVHLISCYLESLYAMQCIVLSLFHGLATYLFNL